MEETNRQVAGVTLPPFFSDGLAVQRPNGFPSLDGIIPVIRLMYRDRCA
jgi:hypothetical protein